MKVLKRTRMGHSRRLAALFVFGIVTACGGGGGAVAPPSAGENEQSDGTGGTGGTGTPPGGNAGTGGSATVSTPNETFSPQTVTIGTGESVTWQFSGSRHNVTFGSLRPAGGNIPDTEPGGAVTRSFATEGSYDYVCTRHSGMTGRVVVSDAGAPGGAPAAPPPPPPALPSGILVQATLTSFSPERLEIAPGTTVTWEFSGGTNGIIFDDDSPPGGNIPDSPAGTRVSRTFPAEGDYDYHSSRDSNVDGRIRVR